MNVAGTKFLQIVTDYNSLISGFKDYLAIDNLNNTLKPKNTLKGICRNLQKVNLKALP
ncbi:hypothetical protein DesyoDRAFT_3466 [Desulfosporosinus youngiae DSM 17734]|uniref:Uncharacterized protein n=1 Tax=Desulfosporosinus youngiae DSM 17734 TaxID=768710 RepID=H5XW25_9FIRM|nr:hypothetical protein DesyoDRAFT_3466 [Desulfosporosinus youngiae DSM 17734]